MDLIETSCKYLEKDNKIFFFCNCIINIYKKNNIKSVK